MINNEDFKNWLSDPVTQFFVKWVKANQDVMKNEARDLIYAAFTIGEVNLSKKAIIHNSVALGLEKILDTFQECYYQSDVETKLQQELKEIDRNTVPDVIGDMIKFVYGGNNDNS